MNTFFQDNFIINKELEHLTKEVKKHELNKTIKALSCFDKMQKRIIAEQNIDVANYKRNAGKNL